MESFSAHFIENAQQYKFWLTELLRTLIGTVLVGLSLACLHLIYFLYQTSKLPKTSREYLHKREHLETETLIRYAITLLCIFTIDALLLIRFDWAPLSFSIGLIFCLVYLGVDFIKKRKNESKKGAEKAKHD